MMRGDGCRSLVGAAGADCAEWFAWGRGLGGGVRGSWRFCPRLGGGLSGVGDDAGRVCGMLVGRGGGRSSRVAGGWASVGRREDVRVVVFAVFLALADPLGGWGGVWLRAAGRRCYLRGGGFAVFLALPDSLGGWLRWVAGGGAPAVLSVAGVGLSGGGG